MMVVLEAVIVLVFYTRDNRSYYFDSFGGSSDNFLLQQFPKPISYENYKFQDKNSNLRGVFCFYFSYLIERMDFSIAVLKIHFEIINANKSSTRSVKTEKKS